MSVQLLDKTRKINKLLHLIKPPCKKCPYTLRQVQFVDNPCPNCKLNNYQMYRMIIKDQHMLRGFMK